MTSPMFGRGFLGAALHALTLALSIDPSETLAQVEQEFVVVRQGGTSVPAFRRGSCFYFDDDWNGSLDRIDCDGQQADEYLWGVWTNDGKVRRAQRTKNCISFPRSIGGTIEFCYDLNINRYEVLVGDWNGDRRDDIAFRFNNLLSFDTNLDGCGSFPA